jgi:hypothetical protein
MLFLWIHVCACLFACVYVCLCVCVWIHNRNARAYSSQQLAYIVASLEQMASGEPVQGVVQVGATAAAVLLCSPVLCCCVLLPSPVLC